MTSQTYETALSIIQEFFPGCVDIECATLESLHIDSFMLIQITLSLETKFGFEFEDSMFEPDAFQTLGQLANYVEDRVIHGSNKKLSS